PEVELAEDGLDVEADHVVGQDLREEAQDRAEVSELNGGRSSSRFPDITLHTRMRCSQGASGKGRPRRAAAPRRSGGPGNGPAARRGIGGRRCARPPTGGGTSSG